MVISGVGFSGTRTVVGRHLEREGSGGSSRGDADLGEDVRQVPRDRLVAEDERGGDLLVGVAGGDEAQHLDLTGGKAAGRWRW